MVNIKTQYILRMADDVLKSYEAVGVQRLLDSGEFDPRDFLYDCGIKQWLRPMDLGHIFTYFEPDSIKNFVKPNFIPPSISKITYSEEEFEEVFTLLQETRKKLNCKESAIKALKKSRSHLEKDYLDQAEQKSNIIEENISLKRQASVLEDEKNSILIENKGLINLTKQLEKQIEYLNSIKDELTAIKEKKESLFNQNEQVQNDLDKTLKIAEKFKKKISLYKVYVKNERIRADHAEKEVLKLNQVVRKLTELRSRDEVIIKGLEKYKRKQSEKEKEDLDRLIGDSFEVDNGPHWFIQVEDEVKGPFTFQDIKSLQKYNKIDPSTPVKKIFDTFWTTADKDFELSADVVTSTTMIDGEEVFRFFIQRANYRAPFKSIALIEIDGQEFTGFCTSLSLGGVFIELTQYDETFMKQGTSVNIKISAGSLPVELQISGVIRNTGYGEAIGLGIEFRDLLSDQSDMIMEYITSYLGDFKNVA